MPSVDTADRRLVEIKDTRFIFRTNFSGDPERDNYGSSERKASIIIPTLEQAQDLLDNGYNVKARATDAQDADELTGLGFSVTLKPPKPGHENDGPVFYVVIKVNYDVKYPPKVCLVNERGVAVELNEDTIERIDHVRVKNVKALLSPYQRDPSVNRKTLYVRTMYVEQDIDDDPYAAMYAQPDTEEDPF